MSGRYCVLALHQSIFLFAPIVFNACDGVPRTQTWYSSFYLLRFCLPDSLTFYFFPNDVVPRMHELSPPPPTPYGSPGISKVFSVYIWCRSEYNFASCVCCLSTPRFYFPGSFHVIFIPSFSDHNSNNIMILS